MLCPKCEKRQETALEKAKPFFIAISVLVVVLFSAFFGVSVYQMGMTDAISYSQNAKTK